MFERKKFEEDKPRFSIMERLMGKTDTTTSRNAYLHRHLKQETKDLLKGDKEVLIDRIKNKLGTLKRTDLREDLSGSRDLIEQDLDNFKSSQLIRILLILEGLDREETTQSLGQQIETDVQDEQEHGGVVVFDDGNQIIFAEVEDDDPKNQEYSLPLVVKQKAKYIAEYHLHAIKDDCSEFVGPSSGGGAIMGVGSDIINSRMQNKTHGSHHGVVVTKLPDNQFNITYYSTIGKEKGAVTKTVVCNIGDFEYTT